MAEANEATVKIEQDVKVLGAAIARFKQGNLDEIFLCAAIMRVLENLRKPTSEEVKAFLEDAGNLPANNPDEDKNQRASFLLEATFRVWATSSLDKEEKK